MSLEPQREPHLSFLNALFVYPLSANLPRGPASNTNVQLEIRLLDHDDSPHSNSSAVQVFSYVRTPSVADVDLLSCFLSPPLRGFVDEAVGRSGVMWDTVGSLPMTKGLVSLMSLKYNFLVI